VIRASSRFYAAEPAAAKRRFLKTLKRDSAQREKVGQHNDSGMEDLSPAESVRTIGFVMQDPKRR
jgi:hypothetical protein